MSAPNAGIRWQIAEYAAGSLGVGIMATVPSVLLLYFCTDVVGISPVTATIIILIPKLWALLWDPYVGQLSDGLNSRWGRRAPFMLIGSLLSSAAFLLLFAPPQLPLGLMPLWLGGIYFALVCGYSLYAIPYIAISSELSDADLRARYISWRMTFVMIGVLIGGALSPALVEWAGGGTEGYRLMAGGLALFCLLTMLVAVFAADRRPTPAAARDTLDVRKAFRAFRGTSLPPLAAGYIAQMAGVSSVSAAMPYIVVGLLDRTEGEIGSAMAVMLLASMVAMIPWAVISRRSRRSMLPVAVCTMAVATAATGLALATDAGWVAFVCILAIVGLGFAGLQVLPFMEAANRIVAEGRGDEGVLTGIWMASEKLGLALGPVLVGAAISTVGRGDGLIAFVAIIPTALALISLPFVAPRIRVPHTASRSNS